MSEESISSERSTRNLEYGRAVRGLILAAAAVATIVLIGWLFHVEPMKRLVQGLTSMNPMTAICFECACAALWLLKDGRPFRRREIWVRVLALFVLYVGGAKLIDLAAGTSLCPDALLFKSQLDFGQAYPSRIAPNVAASFVLLALGLLVLDRERWPSFLHPQYLTAPILGAALIAIVGYAYDSSGFYKVRQYIPMALHSAIDFILVSGALILCRPQRGFMRLLPRGSAGARSYARMLPACILIPTSLGGIALYGADQGWFAARGTGAAAVAVVTVIALSVFAFFNSIALNRIEKIQQLAYERQQQLLLELDTGNRALQLEIAERKRLEAKATHEATHDALTGLPNRLLFLDRLQNSISRTIRNDNACALFYVDIDNFKPVNDRYGHQAGDELLKAIAQRLRAVMRDVDTIARLGGDEFAAIMDTPADQEHALNFANRLSDAVIQPYSLKLPGLDEPIDVTIGISIGIALFPNHASGLDDLVRIADIAMYRAKRDGKTLGAVAEKVRLAVSP